MHPPNLTHQPKIRSRIVRPPMPLHIQRRHARHVFAHAIMPLWFRRRLSFERVDEAGGEGRAFGDLAVAERCMAGSLVCEVVSTYAAGGATVAAAVLGLH
tara:strand:- start:7022 stop:7321 length:300 start_codon:yes stop_codon:yes gene_type:complete